MDGGINSNIDVNLVIKFLSQQRNTALDTLAVREAELAVAKRLIEQLQEEEDS